VIEAHVFQEIPDTLQSPLPAGVGALVRFLFELPQWFQIGGAIVGMMLALVVLVLLWRRRSALWTWVRTRPGGVKIAMAVAIALLVLGGALLGFTSWNYTQHSNDFCVGCHVMDPAAGRFSRSEHAKLECHDCHQQPITASLRQLYLWVKERPHEIGEHAPVPDRICRTCHVVEDPGQTWERISATAGHRVHLESADPALAEAQCVTCHGVEVHRFVPADETCGQAGCHEPRDTRIVLGRMSSDTTSFHCLACHEFTAPVGERTPIDTARAGLVPAAENCLGCHDMRRILVDFDVNLDPHRGVCGMCHNPHEQQRPQAAIRTCTEAGCHAQPEQLSGFHRGLAHRRASDCQTCHAPHNWIAPTECRACHRDLR
jgi:nitrate/TMAO reductase-like tetraheme cytochrome c subunit